VAFRSVEHFFVLIVAGNGMHSVSLSFLHLIDGNFAAAAILISFGALIGKVGPVQVVVMVLLEVVFYSFNKHVLLLDAIGIADLGGTVIIHVSAQAICRCLYDFFVVCSFSDRLLIAMAVLRRKFTSNAAVSIHPPAPDLPFLTDGL
jgi:hypothetical protein